MAHLDKFRDGDPPGGVQPDTQDTREDPREQREEGAEEDGKTQPESDAYLLRYHPGQLAPPKSSGSNAGQTSVTTPPPLGRAPARKGEGTWTPWGRLYQLGFAPGGSGQEPKGWSWRPGAP